MDMTIKIVGTKIETTLFEKPLALHLYIPPHSCHPLGAIIGLVMGNVLRIFQLCSRHDDIENHLCKFFARLLDHGYQSKKMIPLFDRAISNTREYPTRSDTYQNHLRELKKAINKRRVFFTFHFILTTHQHESYNNSGGSMSSAHRKSLSATNSPTVNKVGPNQQHGPCLQQSSKHWEQALLQEKNATVWSPKCHHIYD